MHTVFADCDRHGWTYNRHAQNFNPHSPRRLWRVSIDTYYMHRWFQSTQSSQTVTNYLFLSAHICGISIHTVLADCDGLGEQFSTRFIISIHTVLADCDYYHLLHLWQDYRFQSTRSSQTVTCGKSWLGGERWISIHTVLADCDKTPKVPHLVISISIHTVLADCDKWVPGFKSKIWDFNPHSPRRLWPNSWEG